MYHMVTIVDNTVVQLKFAKRENLNVLTKEEGWWACEMTNVFMNLGDTLSQRIHVSTHIVHFKYLTILFIDCTSIKLKTVYINYTYSRLIGIYTLYNISQLAF